MSDKKNIVPIVLSIAVHVIVIGLLLFNFAWDEEVDVKHQYVDAPINAQLVTAPERPKPDANAIKKQQEAEKKRKEEERKKQLEKEQEQKRLEAEKQRQEQKKLEQEKQQKLEEEKQKQLALEQQKKLEEEKKQKELEEKQRKEAEEKQRLEEEKRKKEEAERKRKEAEAEAEKKRKEEELRKLEEEMAAMDNEFFEAQRDTVRQGQIMSEVEKLTALITAKIKRNWYPPKAPGACSIRISMGPGGVVLQTEALGGDYDYCETGKAAITRSSPLPSSDDPEVMNQLREMTIVFDPSFKE
ncbi:cell envelope integrity protein TolA [Kangiella aquimarina]|uniref:Cell envelope integrity protein TolA n=1 Tax=Kangiella aquimarina TaxID=261965 RepID=A0ABZ0X6X4_9GAMM|nr:cell envelope integrity protein TolA [Kangiella aquimarina]WQG86362.1 cell envelope integrity protein TolA [Kangiella aquimarina]